MYAPHLILQTFLTAFDFFLGDDQENNCSYDQGQKGEAHKNTPPVGKLQSCLNWRGGGKGSEPAGCHLKAVHKRPFISGKPNGVVANHQKIRSSSSDTMLQNGLERTADASPKVTVFR